MYEPETDLLVLANDLSQVGNVVSLILNPGSSRLPSREFTDISLEVDKKA